MSLRLVALAAATLAFAVITTLALTTVGFLGILRPHFTSWGEVQVFVDLVILGVLACIWLARDARASGLSAWPFVILTLAAGSFGPLAYLMVREVRDAARPTSHRDAGA